MPKPFVHLHVHDDFSMLDGYGTIPRYVAKAKKDGAPALAQTNHGNIAGSYEFYVECMAQGIEPVLGCEFYFEPDAKKAKDDKSAERFHVVFLARNEAGFRTLVDLSSATHRQFYYKPLLDRPLIEGLSKADRKNLIVLSGCAGSRISQMALGREPGSAIEEVRWWQRQFPNEGNFWMELQHHGTVFDRKLNGRLVKLAKKAGLPHVITNDPHYVEKDECGHHDALLAIQTAADLDDPGRFRFEGDGYHLKTRKEIERTFDRAGYARDVVGPGVANTLVIAKSCKTRIKAWDTRSWHIPKFPDVSNAQKALRRQANEGLERRGLEGDKDYRKRLKHELEQFANVGMADFLLIQADINREAKERGIRVGPGRGSVCGTLVGYAIDIHKIDPIRYDLLFERFLNPERPKMPDIDTDFQRSRRAEIIEYAVEKYGDEYTMRVGAYQKMKVKKTFQNLARTYGIPFQRIMELSKLILEDEDGDAVLPAEIQEGYPEFHNLLVGLLGIKSGISRHPAGIIIFDPEDPIRHLVPEMWIASSKQFVSQFDLDAAAGLGLLKQDFLGLRTLDTVQETVDLIQARHGVTLEPDDWVPGEEKGDAKVWKMLRDGWTSGVFQMEGGANHRGIQEIACSEFEDIVSCTSLYRAGPMIAGAPKRFNENRRDKKVRVAHKSLQDHLATSWGEMIYQEQMFSILREIGGLSWARVDDVKTAMAKKDPEKMAKVMEDALEGFRKHGQLPDHKAVEIWKMIESQSAYLFNRSHAVAYSMLTYQTARLKLLYPLEFLAGLLRTVEPKNEQDKGKREAYMNEALRMGFKISPPDVNVSDDRFMPHGKDELLFGLVDITNVGTKAVEKLMAAKVKKVRRLRKKGLKTTKPFRKVEDVAIAVNNVGTMKALAAAGALRSLGVEPEVEKQEELLRWQFTDNVAPYREKYAKKIRLPKTNNGRFCVPGEIVKLEKKKTKTGNDFMTWVIRHEPGVEFKITLWSDASDLWGLQKGSIVMVAGRWNAQWSNVAISDSDQVTVLRRITKKSIEKAKAKKEKAS